ncbi:T9SS type A sorting domain-containing protein [Flavobacterium aquidurense]|uniref:Secretion system C-terminal sorting domain-containing protein n=1 Tax=Flavobacterium aquidurense TaxID=362413 RepID=A0A0Q0VY47_9FLAO|nr:T9SS type A sorting domain-containing protein [Flavobacterium aquidurense]KQB38642.1 hypothetical protein RC62_2002 [Flavobacterium aquidurense]
MKKTLLFFLLLFTTIFYAQVSNIEHCAQDNSFNLTTQKALLIGNLNPAETTVSYHLSLEDANNNLNAIANPSNYITTNSQTIYARIDNLGTITTNYFGLILNSILIANTEVVYVNCVPRIVITATGGNSNYEYSHFGVTYTQNNIVNNPSPGPQTVYVRDGNGCVASKSLIVESLSPLTWRAKRTNVTCQGANDGTIEITASGGKAPYSFSLGNENGFTASNIFRNLNVATHTIYIKDATGCVISLLMDVYQENPSIVIAETITNDSNDTNEGKIVLNVSGGVSPYNYSLKNSSGILVASQVSNSFEGLTAGSYEVMVTDSRGCTLSKAINILNAPTPLTTTSTVTPITCVITTGTITITPHGGTLPYQYSIDNGNSYSNSNVFSNLDAGTYNLKVLDAQNSVVSAIATIDPIKIPEITVTYKNILCHGDSNGSILVGASNGKSPNLFSINGGTYGSYNLFENLKAGNYVLSVKDSNGCVVSKSVILEDPEPITAEVTFLDRFVTIKASGGYGKYEYALDGGNYQQSNIYSNVSYGNHTIYVKDPNGCILSKVISVVKPVPLVASFVVDKGTVTITTSGGILPYRYALQKATGFPIITTSSNIFTDMVNGSYKIIVNDSQGNSFALFDVIISESALFTANATSTPVNCNGSKGTITTTATGGKSPYQYSIDSANFSNSNVFSNLNAGSYLINVRDSNNFTTTASVTISSAKPVLVTAEIVSEISCNGANNGIIKANVIQGQAPYLYAFDGSSLQSADTFTNVNAGTHTISVKDQNGCTATVSITVAEPKQLKSTVVVDGKKITASTTDGTAPYSYVLQNNSGLTVGPQNSDTFDDLPNGLYNLQITDAKGCLLLRNDIIISDLSLLSAKANITPITCNNTKAEITVLATGGSGSYVYSIDNGVNYSASNIFSNLSPGYYTVSVKDSQNAVITITTTIIPYIPLTSTAIITKSIDCTSNASIYVNTSGGKRPYQYSLDNGVTYTANNIFTNLNAGNYFVRVKDSLDCTVITNSIILEQPVPLTATVANTKIVDCSVNYNSTITITATGGQPPYLYAVNSLTNYQTDNMYFGAAPGTHTVSVKDANGCVFNSTFVVESPSLLTLTSTITEATICGGKSSVTINAIGGQAPYTYSFNGGNSYSPISTSDLSPGGYTIFAKDSNGCIATIYVIIAYPGVPVSTIWTITNTTTYNSNDGSITLAATAGTAPYTYSLLNSNNTVVITDQSSNTFSNLAPGTYGIIVKDAKGCSSLITQATITAPSLEILSATATVIQPNCVNPMGIITIDATGGTAPYEYSIDNGAYSFSNTFIVTQPGNYNITVRDSQNATYTSVIVIRPLDPLFLNATVVSNASCISNGIITAITTGGQAPYVYSLNGGVFQNTNIFTNLSPGVYTLEARDANDCIANTTIMLTEPEPIFATVTTDNQTIIVTAVGGTGNYQYSLDGIIFQSSNIFTIVNYGTYNVFIRDQNGCMVIVATTLTPPSPLIDDKDEITIEFKPGQTLGDLVIQGQNIKWYSNQNPLSGKTTKLTEVTLPLSTVLTNGTTYYASQTINGIESIDRLAVTAKLSGSLSTPDVVMSDFRFYPNPVQHTLNIENSAVIDEIEILSVSGKSILDRKINNTHAQIDLSNVSSGFYFLKVTSEGKVKTTKIVKK